MEIHSKFIVMVLKYRRKMNILREVFKFLLYFCNDIGNSWRLITSLVIKYLFTSPIYNHIANSSSTSFSYNTSYNVYLSFIVPNRNIDSNSPHKRVPYKCLGVSRCWYLVL